MNEIESFMEANGIHKIGRWPVGRYSVELSDGRIGVGIGIAKALREARKPRAASVRKAAA